MTATRALSVIHKPCLPAPPIFRRIDHLRFGVTVAINQKPGAEFFMGSHHFMEAEISLPYSYQLTTCSCFELHKSSPRHLFLLIQDQL